ncbi:porin [Aliihoeflea sp. 2WW]|uniref:porin n=1 Tax=Aliihoeflea sp. 2WW TaxID=1381123 RepID=UPI000463CE0C|nr:porin [Aliihoeflea sp. 2WW]
MNIKSLLLGSAAGLVAVSGAQAADAIVYAEPEPVEYVRVCDMYGAGFFYIPGTETCLQVSGLVWYQMGAADEAPNYHGFAADRWNKSTRARVNFDARSDTEWGTLRGYVRLQGDFNAFSNLNGPLSSRTGSSDGRGTIGFDQAFLELGGFRAGYTESAWVASQGAGVAQFGSHTWGGLSYGYQQRQLISYTFGGASGFAATIALEDDANDNFTPDVVGVVSYNQAWGGVWAKGAYDEDRGTNLVEVDDGGWAAQAGLQLNVPNAPGSSFRLIGYYADNANAYSVGSEWSVLASYRQQFSQTIAASVGAQYFSNIHDFGPALGTETDLDGWQAEAALIWTPVTNFEVRAEYVYTDIDLRPSTNSGFLRLQRSF